MSLSITSSAPRQRKHLVSAVRRRKDAEAGDALWYKDAVIYQLHVRAFHDSDGDGIGDFRGLTQKLDYLQDLGVTALWLLPFYPSPLRDDGYDIADYEAIHPAYGTMRDFQAFMTEAHRRGLRVITELVLNHTSDEHEWFKRSRRAAAGSRWRNFYVWSDTPDKYGDARIIFKDFETSNWAWDSTADAYFWHRFYSHQPDLNYDHPAVRSEMRRVVDFWLDRGVDGLRLDAVPYLFEREGTSCENLPETHAYLRELRRHIDEKHPNRMLLAEANQWPEDARAYFGNGDECNTAFHFPLMPRLFMAIRMEDRFPIIDILNQTPEIPDNSQWMVFLRNHDELTLEMVTDEERDYMYRVYADDPQARINLGIRRRLAPLLANNRRRIELMNGLLLSLPGTPVLYYGDEIGMGDNIYLGDRNGVRTPMQWSADRNAGFSRANPQRLYLPINVDPEYHYETVNVEAQQNNPTSLLWWMKRLIALRKRHRAFGRGTIEFLYPDNAKVLAFVRKWEDETVLVVANLSRFVQAAEIDLSAYEGWSPAEMFGGSRFPRIGELPYFLTLGPHSFYWFNLEPGEANEPAATASIPSITVRGQWQDVFRTPAQGHLEAALARYIRPKRWFAGKARRLQATELMEAIPLGRASGREARLAILRATYLQGDEEIYVVPIGFADDETAQLDDEHAEAMIARVNAGETRGTLYECILDEEYRQSLLHAIGSPRKPKGTRGEIVTSRTRAFRVALRTNGSEPGSTLLRGEQSNTSVLYDEKFILKLYRKPEFGRNPELEIGEYLTETRKFGNAPPLAGAVEYRRPRGEPMTLMVLHEYVRNQGDAWSQSMDALGSYLEHVVALPEDTDPLAETPRSLIERLDREIPGDIHNAIGPYVQTAQQLGRRTAELHNALASDDDRDAFKPERFTPMYQRSLYQSMRALAGRTMRLLHENARRLPEPERALATQVATREDDLLKRMREQMHHRISAMRIRSHGDYHLAQVLNTGNDFMIIDFEGEPARPLTERRLKRSPLTDVAGLLRSFDYAANTALRDFLQRTSFRPEQAESLRRWAEAWYDWCGATFLRAYAGTIEPRLIPATREHLGVLLDAYLLDKAMYELNYELNNRPEWVAIPLHGILRLLGKERS